MRFMVSETSRSALIPLRDAMLCMDCEFITPATDNACSLCGGHALLRLMELLGMLMEEACSTTDINKLTWKLQSCLGPVDASYLKSAFSRQKN